MDPSSIYVTKHDAIDPKRPPVLCDKILSKKLVDHPLLKDANTDRFWLITGTPGCGKTSTWVSALCAKHMLKKAFDRIYIFMPEASLSSIGETCALKKHEPEYFYHELTPEALNEVTEKVAENKEKDWTSLIVFDDVQAQLKDKRLKNNLLMLISNHRHYRLSIMIAAQVYKRIPLEIRLQATDLFMFNPTPENEVQIHKEVVPLDKESFAKVMKIYNEYNAEHDTRAFLYFNLVKPRIFIGWNTEIVVRNSNL